MHIVVKYKIHLYLLQNRHEKLAKGSLFCLLLKLVQINFIFTDNVRILYIYWYHHCFFRHCSNIREIWAKLLSGGWSYLLLTNAYDTIIRGHLCTMLWKMVTEPVLTIQISKYGSCLSLPEKILFISQLT